jgi:DNA-binding transcriptional regulator YhcF (GntR family)
MSEDRPDYMADTQDAMEMLGAGYETPLEIHPQSTVIRRRGFEMTEEVVPAFVKISTGFKKELREIDATALKVWLFIALSINRNSENAHPSLETLAKNCGMGENTVIRAVRYLESAGLLSVSRANRKVNIYSIPEYVSANQKSTSKTEADNKTTSVNQKTASQTYKTTSAYGRSNQINQIDNQINNKPSAQKLTAQDTTNLDTFTGRFGKFSNASEVDRFLAMVSEYGMDKLRDVMQWVERKQIHLENRPALLDAIETAAGRWSGRSRPREKQTDTKSFMERLERA